MAIPLRKDEPEAGDEEITAADLAIGRRPVSNTPATQPVSAHDFRPSTESANAPDTANGTALFPGQELDALRNRWREIQIAFVDEPRTAVREADSLVASATKRLAEVSARERAGLEQQWDQRDNISTEDLRIAFQRYRSFFHRLLSL